MQQQSYRIDKDLPLLAFDLLARIVAVRIDPGPPFFSALYTLAVDHTGCGAGFSTGLLAALHVECVMDFVECAVIVPAIQILMQRALRRQGLRHIWPLTARAEHKTDPINKFA